MNRHDPGTFINTPMEEAVTRSYEEAEDHRLEYQDDKRMSIVYHSRVSKHLCQWVVKALSSRPNDPTPTSGADLAKRAHIPLRTLEQRTLYVDCLNHLLESGAISLHPSFKSGYFCTHEEAKRIKSRMTRDRVISPIPEKPAKKVWTLWGEDKMPTTLCQKG